MYRMKLPEILPHPKGEPKTTQKKQNYLLTDDTKLAVDTFGGRVHVEWDPASSVTPLGQLPFFIEFLKLGNLLLDFMKKPHRRIPAAKTAGPMFRVTISVTNQE